MNDYVNVNLKCTREKFERFTKESGKFWYERDGVKLNAQLEPWQEGLRPLRQIQNVVNQMVSFSKER